jgi:dihydroxyacetone kinase-like protein
MGLKAGDVKYIIDKIDAVMEENREYLTELDSAIGDADHGINMSKGFRAVSRKIKDIAVEDIGVILKTVGITLVSTVGGASGPLYGTAFIRAGAEVSGKSEIDINDFAAMLTGAEAGIKMRGRADLGDKTMIDAIEPALNAIKDGIDKGLSCDEILRLAAKSAQDGVEGTKNIQARKGRASYLGERSIGHQDPGATSSYLIFKTIYESVIELENRY